jgi:type IV secretion system protein VirB9
MRSNQINNQVNTQVNTRVNLLLKALMGVLPLGGFVALVACTPVMSTDTQSVGMFPSDVVSGSNKNSNKDSNVAGASYQSPQMEHQVKTQIITEYVPIPVPGQLMPPPSQSKTPNSNYSSAAKQQIEEGEKAVASANQEAVLTPDSNSFFNAISTYDYMPGALYTIYTAPMKITDITLAPGEKIISNAAGDTLRWQVSQTYSGQADQVSQHILVKPDLPNLDNTMVINTDQHVYHLILKSTNNDTYMVAVSWRYPGGMIQAGQNIPGEASENFSGGTAGSSGENYGLNLTNLDFDYQFGMVKGVQPPWYPVRIFNDGRQTFIQFPSNFFASETPVLYVADSTGVYGTMVNWRLKGPYMIVDTVLQKARLQIGIAKTGQTIVQIEHQSSHKS